MDQHQILVQRVDLRLDILDEPRVGTPHEHIHILCLGLHLGFLVGDELVHCLEKFREVPADAVHFGFPEQCRHIPALEV